MSSRSDYAGVQFWSSFHDDDLDDNDGDDNYKSQVHSQPHQVDVSRHQWHEGSQFFSSPNLPPLTDWLVDPAWGAYGSWRLSAQMRAYCRVDPPDLTKRSPTQWVTYEGIELLWQLKKSQRQKQSFCDKDIDPLNGAQPSIIIKIVIINNMNIKINTVDSSSAPPFYTSRKWPNFFHFFTPPSTR